MNAIFKIFRCNVLAKSILVTAFLLPLATFAQGLTETESLEQYAISRAADCAHCVNVSDPQELRNCKKSRDTMAFWKISDPRVLVERVGFSEVDPTEQRLGNVGGSIETDRSQKQNMYAGFAETDPANFLSLAPTALTPSTDTEQHHVYAGFSETNPATDISQELGTSPYRSFVDCLYEDALPGQSGYAGNLNLGFGYPPATYYGHAHAPSCGHQLVYPYVNGYPVGYPNGYRSSYRGNAHGNKYARGHHKGHR